MFHDPALFLKGNTPGGVIWTLFMEYATFKSKVTINYQLSALLEGII